MIDRVYRMGGFAVFLLFWCVWVLLNGRLTWEIAAFGILAAGALYGFCLYALGLTVRKDLQLCARAPLFAAYAGLLVWEILCANAAVLRRVLSPRFVPSPVIVTVKPALRTKLARVLYANSITLTPGTITVTLEDGVYRIHCLDERFSHGLGASPMVRLLQKLEAGYDG